MKTIDYVSPEIGLLQLTNEGILCASSINYESVQNESIIEEEYNW